MSNNENNFKSFKQELLDFDFKTENYIEKKLKEINEFIKVNVTSVLDTEKGDFWANIKIQSKDKRRTNNWIEHIFNIDHTSLEIYKEKICDMLHDIYSELQVVPTHEEVEEKLNEVSNREKYYSNFYKLNLL